MKYFITGGTGFLGSTLVRRLNDGKNEVIAFGRNVKKGRELEKEGIRFVRGDLRDFNALNDSMQGVDYVFHSGALSSPWGDFQDFYSINVDGTRNALRSAYENNVSRFIHVSTPSIYFNFKDVLNIPEDSKLPKYFVNDYAFTKFLAEKVVDSFGDDLETITIRPRAIFGIGDNAIFPRLIQRNEKGLPVINKGQAIVDITHVDNVVDSLLLCRDASNICLGQKYNITNGEPKKLIEIMEKVFVELGIDPNYKFVNYHLVYGIASLVEMGHKLFNIESEPSILKYSIGVFGKSQTLDISKARNELGYNPQISIDEGINKFAKWWKSQ